MNIKFEIEKGKYEGIYEVKVAGSTEYMDHLGKNRMFRFVAPFGVAGVMPKEYSSIVLNDLGAVVKTRFAYVTQSSDRIVSMEVAKAELVI